MDRQQILATAVAIAREAGALLRDAQGDALQIGRKSTAIDLVTQYDTAAEALIAARLNAHFPDHSLFGEEGAESGSGSGYVWHIDPIDGTVNFAHGFPVFCVSLALYDDNAPVLGVIYDPTRDECFTAVHGAGAWLTRGDRQVRLAVSRTTQLIDSLLATGFPYDRHTSPLNNLDQFGAFLKRAQGMRRAGSAALDMAYVAAGRLDGFWEFKLGRHDVAAAMLLVTEAGGRVTLMDGSPAQLAPRLALVVSNGLIHDEMLAVLKAVNAPTLP